MTPKPWLRRYPLIAYFALAYGISWSGIVIVLGATGFDLANLRPLDTGIIFALMLLGPSASGLSMTAHLEGRAGLCRLWLSLVRWHVGIRWYALALMTMPVVLLAVLWPLGILLDPAFEPVFSGHFSQSDWWQAASRKSDGRALRHRVCWPGNGCSWPACRSGWGGHCGTCWLTSVRTSP